MLIIRLLVVLMMAAGAHAASIAFFNDYSKDLTAVASAVEQLETDHTVHVANSATEFEFILQNESIDVAILFLQDVPSDAEAFPVFSTFVGSGGKVIFADGNQRASWADLLGFAYSGNTNLTNFAWLDATLTAQTGGASQTIENPGYITFSMGLVLDETTLGVFDNGDAAVLYLDNHKIINGFLLDTDSLLNASVRADASASMSNIGTILSAQVDYLLDPPTPFPNQPFIPPPTQSSDASSSSAVSSASSSFAASSESQSSASSTATDDNATASNADTNNTSNTAVEVPLNLSALLALLFGAWGLMAIRSD